MILENVLTKAPVPARKRNHQIPTELERIIGNCLEKDRNLRYQRASEVLEDLRSLERASMLASAQIAATSWRLSLACGCSSV